MGKRALLIIIIIVAAGIATGSALLVSHYRHKADSPALVPQKANAPTQTSQQAAQNNQPAENVPVSTSVALNGLAATESNDKVRASAQVVNSTDTAATCVFTFSNSSDKPVVRQTKVSTDGKTCDSGDIPAQEFTFLGTWHLTLRYYTSTNTQAVATADVTIQ